jgi:hypothetical protein
MGSSGPESGRVLSGGNPMARGNRSVARSLNWGRIIGNGQTALNWAPGQGMLAERSQLGLRRRIGRWAGMEVVRRATSCLVDPA